MSIYKQEFDKFLVDVAQNKRVLDNLDKFLYANEIVCALSDNNEEDAFIRGQDGKQYNPFAYFLEHAEDLANLVEPLKAVMLTITIYDKENKTNMLDRFMSAEIRVNGQSYSANHPKAEDIDEKDYYKGYDITEESLKALKSQLVFQHKSLASFRDSPATADISSPSPSDAFADIARKFRDYIAMRRTRNSAFMQSWNTANIIRSLKVELEQAIIDADAMVKGNAKLIAARILNPTTEDDRCLLRLVKHPTNWTVSWVCNTTSLVLLRGIVNETHGIDELKADIEEKQRRLGDFVATPPVSLKRLG